MLAYRFQNERGLVKTAWLDTFDSKFKNKSGTQTYTIYTRVANQYYNYHMTLLESDSIPKRIDSVISRLLETYTFNPGQDEILMNIAISSYVDKYNDNNNKFHNDLYTPLNYIRYQIHDFNHFIHTLSEILNMSFMYPSPRPINTFIGYAETKKINPSIIHPYYVRTPILTHRKGYRGFVRDYQMDIYW